MLVDCNHAKLQQVPPVIGDTTVVEIDLSDNYIERLNNDSFENCLYLGRIDLSWNYIKDLPNNLFYDTLKLRKVVLSNNLIEYNNESLPLGVFRNQFNLKSVSLQSFRIFHPSIDDFAATLRKLPLTLEELNVNIPVVDGYAINLVNFTSLKRLGLFNLSPIMASCRLTNYTFRPLANLPIEELRFSSDNILAVEPLAFYHFPKLTTLDMSETTGLSVADFYPAWIGLQHNTNSKTGALGHDKSCFCS